MTPVSDNSQRAHLNEENDRVIMGNQEKRPTAILGYLIGSLALPPLSIIISLIIAWRKGIFHLVLPPVTIISSILSILSIVLIYASLIPVSVAREIFESQSPLENSQFNLLAIFTIIVSIAGLVGGIYFWKKAKRELRLLRGAIWFLMIILVVQILVAFASVYWVNKIIYQQMGIFYKGIQDINQVL